MKDSPCNQSASLETVNILIIYDQIINGKISALSGDEQVLKPAGLFQFGPCEVFS